MKPRKDLLGSVHNALRVLKLFNRENPVLGMSEIAKMLGIHPSSVSRILRTLLTEGFVMKDNNSGKYRLGYTIFSLGEVFVETDDLHEFSIDMMKELTHVTGETTQLAIVDDLDILIIESIESKHALSFTTRKGYKTPLYNSSLGRVLLAFGENSLLEKTLKQKYTSEIKKSMVEKENFIKEIESIRNRGYSISLEEKYEGVNALAAPILNKQGQAIAALNIAGPSQRLKPNKFKGVSNHLLKVSKKISKDYAFYTGS